MRQPVVFILILSVFIILTDLYTFRGISVLSQGFAVRHKLYLSLIFWFITVLGLIWLVWLSLSFKSFTYEETYRNIAIFFGFFVLFYVPKLFFNVFQLFNDITVVLAKGISLLFPASESISSSAQKISRSEFLLQVGLIIAAIPFFSIIWGIWNRSRKTA